MALSLEHFVELVRQSELVAPPNLAALLPPLKTPLTAQQLAEELVSQGLLTKFQVEEIARGRGSRLWLGNYLLLDKIGEGGMGEVFKAQHRRMDRIVALKILSSERSTHNKAIERFDREIKISAMLSHSNIVVSHDADFQDDVNYLVMEYVDGMNLTQRVRRFGPVTPGEAVNIIRQTAEGLAFAHAQGIIHRDIKPSNLMVDTSGLVRILDMGLARVQMKPDSKTVTDITNSGVVMGTIDFLAPEQAIDVRRADHRSDIYSLGCTLFFLLTGKPIFEGRTVVEKVLAHQNNVVPRLSDFRQGIPAELERIYARMTAKNPDERQQSMEGLLSELATVGQAEAITPPPEPSPLEASAISLPIVLEGSGSHATVLHTSPTKLARQDSSPLRWVPWMVGTLLVASVAILFDSCRMGAPGEPNSGKVPVPQGLVSTIPGQTESPSDDSKIVALTTDHAPSIDLYQDGPPRAIAPFSQAQAEQFQKEWASYLSSPVKWKNTIDMAFQLVPPGEFEQGATAEEIDSLIATDSNPEFQKNVRLQGPRHKVHLTHPLYVGTFEVSVREYQSVGAPLSEGPAAEQEASNDIQRQLADILPMLQIRWLDAAQFCNALSRKEGRPACYTFDGENVSFTDTGGYRLLTEAEWEYSCRSGTVTRWYSTDLPEEAAVYAWLRDNSDDHLHPGGRLRPNAFGLHDMHGNVWEFCNDHFGDYPATAARDPYGPATGAYRVLRGGSWRDDSSGASSANRGLLAPHDVLANGGFRIAIRAASVSRSLKRSAP